MKNLNLILFLVLSVVSQTSFASNPLKDSIMHTPNGVLRLIVKNVTHKEETFYYITISDTTKRKGMPIDLGIAGPFAYNLKELVQACYKNTIPLVKELFPNICNWVNEEKLKYSTIYITLNEREVENKMIKLLTQDKTLVIPIIQEIMQNNNFDFLIDKAFEQVYKEVTPSRPFDKLPDFIKNEMKKGDYSYNYTLGIFLKPQKLSEF